jgi:inner membrane protein
MFIGHVPAGYLATTFVLDRVRAPSTDRRRLLLIGLAASVLPDVDLLYFYLVDHRRHVHHTYLPHLPGFWLLVLAAWTAGLILSRSNRVRWLALGVAGLNVFLHLVLDTLAGGIEWAWPFSRTAFVVATVPRHYEPWYLNFVLHWTFWCEVALVVAALVMLFRRRSGARRAGLTA